MRITIAFTELIGVNLKLPDLDLHRAQLQELCDGVAAAWTTTRPMNYRALCGESTLTLLSEQVQSIRQEGESWQELKTRRSW